MATQNSSQFLKIARAAKTEMIIEMALDFAAMTRVLSKGSNPQIIPKLDELFAGLDSIHEPSMYDQRHAEFCAWFTEKIDTAEKKLKNGRIKPAGPSSYGHAAKVLDITAKVYVYYCAQPSPEVAQMIVPMLHGALDNQIIGHLIQRFPKAGITAETINNVDRGEYEKLQSLVNTEIREDFNSEIYPVQYDDILFRRLNRPTAASA